MERIATGWKVLAGGGVVVTTLAQTKPEDAISNVAAWAKISGIDALPAFLSTPSIDTWISAIGVAIVLFSLLMWRRKVVHIHHKEIQAQAKTEPSIDLKVHRAIAPGAPREPRTETWMPLHEALRYLVCESEWGHRQARPASRDDFDRLVSLEIRERLARGELHARGAKGGGFSNPDRPTEAIPADYWIHGFIQPHGEIVMADPNRAAAGNPTGSDTYRRVIISSGDMASIWPRSSNAGQSALASFVEPERKEYEASEAAAREKVEAPPAPPVNEHSKAEVLARRIREQPDNAQFDYPTLKCILRAEIRHPKGQRSALAGSPPHATEVMMLVSSIHKHPIPGCSVFLQSIADEGLAETVGLPFSAADTFDAHSHMPHSFYLLHRNLSDPINPDPFVIKLADSTRTLRENAEYKLVLELRAPPYPYPTIVELVIRTGIGLEVECEIISQHLPEINDA